MNLFPGDILGNMYEDMTILLENVQPTFQDPLI